MIYLTDPHPLMFWASDRKRRLGKRAQRIFQEVEQRKHSVIVSIAVLEEAARLIKKKVIRLAVLFRRASGGASKGVKYRLIRSRSDID